MLYEMELQADGSFECLAFVGLETFIGPVAEGISPECLAGLDAFSHAELIFLFDRVQESDIIWTARHPRGIFHQHVGPGLIGRVGPLAMSGKRIIS